MKNNSYTKNLQLLVIGAGPGGYTAAFLAADMGIGVTLVDPMPSPGGVCLYQGCIPSKTLLHAVNILSDAGEAKTFGIDFGKPQIDFNKLKIWKDRVISKLNSGLAYQCKQRGINYIQGKATFLNSNSALIRTSNGDEQTLTFKKSILATGSRAINLSIAPDSPHILDSATALDIKTIPGSLLIIGGGYIGLELGTIYAGLGSKVHVVEMLDKILPEADPDLTDVLGKSIRKTFDSVMLNTKAIKMEENGRSILVALEDKEGKTQNCQYEKVLVATGRKPDLTGLGIENTRIKLNSRGFIKTNPQRLTDDPCIYAVGDITGGHMLAHKALREAKIAAMAISGKNERFEPSAIPSVIFTNPEIAWCGLTERQAAKENRNIKTVKFPWIASGRAVTLNRTEGLTKLIIDPESEKILGAAIVGKEAGELIAEGVLAVETGLTAAKLKSCIHPHPTLSETIMEAAENFYK